MATFSAMQKPHSAWGMLWRL